MARPRPLALAVVVFAAGVFAGFGLAPGRGTVGVLRLFAGISRPGRWPGAALIVTRKGEVLYRGAWGLADVERGVPVRPDTAFHLASCSKQMTSLSILMLAERGRLALDEPASRHLPELNGWADTVTLRHLLTHTSGLPDVYDRLRAVSGHPTNDDALRLLARGRWLAFAPGSRHQYSNTGYDALGAIVARVSGQPFGAFVEENLFRPAGMIHTFAFDEERRRRPGVARGYSRFESHVLLYDDSNFNEIHGAGSVYSSVDDLARYDAFLFGGRFVRADTLQQAFEPARLADGRTVPYGFAWRIGRARGRRWVGHSGHWMGFVSFYLHDLDSGLSVMLLSNDSSVDAEELAFATARQFE